MATSIHNDAILKWLLAAGILVRIGLYFVIAPQSPDAHNEFIDFVAKFHRLPLTRELFCGHQPPLYYILAQPFYAFDSPVYLKVTQLFSLLLSCANLWLIYILAQRTMQRGLPRNISFLLATISYSYLTFSLYVSNDVLAFFIGTLCIYLLHRYIYGSTTKNLVYLALGLAAGLLTKGTFLAFGPVVLIVVFWTEWSKFRNLKFVFVRLMLLGVISIGLGSYKYLENLHYEGRLVVHNLDFFKEIDTQKGVWVGPKTLCNVNLKRLLRHPYVYNGDPVVMTSLPLLFYATFWNKFADLENNFNLAVKNLSFRFLAVLIYIFALFPTLVMILGGVLMTVRPLAVLKRWDGVNKEQLFSFALLLLVIFSFLLVIVAGLKYDIWSCFHSRLALQAFFGLMFMCYSGFVFLKEKFSLIYTFFVAGWLMLIGVYGIYYVLEVSNSLFPF